MGQHFTLGAGPAQIMGQHVLPRLYGCRRLWKGNWADECTKLSVKDRCTNHLLLVSLQTSIIVVKIPKFLDSLYSMLHLVYQLIDWWWYELLIANNAMHYDKTRSMTPSKCLIIQLTITSAQSVTRHRNVIIISESVNRRKLLNEWINEWMSLLWHLTNRRWNYNECIQNVIHCIIKIAVCNMI